LDEISTVVDELTIHINKQTSILDRLNTVNCEKGKRITEIDRSINFRATGRKNTQPESSTYNTQISYAANYRNKTRDKSVFRVEQTFATDFMDDVKQ
jgi:hypothetical protein